MAEYSTLYPETNSDSPSVKSKGGRLVSASEETKNIRKAGHKGKIYQTSFWLLTIPVRFNSPAHNITEMMIKPMDTS